MNDADCIRFLQWSLPRLGLRWAGFRRVRGQVCKRLRRRLAVLGLKALSDYRALLEEGTAEWRQLDGLCRVSVSRFYRDQGVWNCLERELLPQLGLQALARGETRLRIWSAGCASGDEPYTLALMSAVPKPDPLKRTERIVLTGDVPSPAEPPSGCKFHPRCNYAREICSQEVPAWRELSEDHWVACHLAEELELLGIEYE